MQSNFKFKPPIEKKPMQPEQFNVLEGTKPDDDWKRFFIPSYWCDWNLQRALSATRIEDRTMQLFAIHTYLQWTNKSWRIMHVFACIYFQVNKRFDLFQIWIGLYTEQVNYNRDVDIFDADILFGCVDSAICTLTPYKWIQVEKYFIELRIPTETGATIVLDS